MGKARGFLVMIYTVGSGELVKAVIMKHKVCVCFVPSEKAKQMISARLFAWCKEKNIVPWKAPAKPIELINWESQRNSQVVRTGDGPNPDPKRLRIGDPDPAIDRPGGESGGQSETLNKLGSGLITGTTPKVITPKIAGFGTNAL